MKFKSGEVGIWFTADTHFGHKNIVRGVSSWIDENNCRGFDTIEEMNDVIVNNLNKYVQKDDILIHLGDWSMGGINSIWKFRKYLNVKHIHLITGNHDEHIKKNKIFQFPEIDSLQFSFMEQCEFGGELIPAVVSARDMFTTISSYKEIAIDRENIVLSHYSICSWNRMYRGAWMLHGHSHNTLFKDEDSSHWYKNMRIMDVGIDAAFELFGEYRPINFTEIKDIMKRKTFIPIDHHNKKTNG